jgi:carboxyl-terminal processing protease
MAARHSNRIYPHSWNLLNALIMGVFLLCVQISPAKADPVFTNGFEAIAAYHISTPSADLIFSHFVQSLQRQDPSLHIIMQNGRVALFNDAQHIGEWAVPGQNPAAWGELAENILRAACAVSPLLKRGNYNEVSAKVLQDVLVSLDPYSHLSQTASNLTDKSYAELPDKQTGSIGVSVSSNRTKVLISAIIPNGPAAKELQVGDQIIAIDGIDIKGLNAGEVVTRLRGDLGSKAALTIARGGAISQIAVPRLLSKDANVNAKIINKNQLLIDIRRFVPNTASAVQALLENHNEAQYVIFDLRGNRGGILEEAVAIADIFLDQGSIAERTGPHPASHKDYRVSINEHKDNRPVLIMVDGYTASAAEALAGSLQTHRRAIVKVPSL